MLNTMQRGVTLIELAVGMVIIALLFALGAPSFSGWIQNSQIRTSAEAIQNGLQLARAEAVRRNTLVSFQLVSDLTSGCQLSTSGTSWVVSQVVSPSTKDSAQGACDQAPSESADPYIVQKRDATEGSKNAVVAADSRAIIFNGLGRLSCGTPPNQYADYCGTGATTVSIDISNPIVGGACKPAGTMRCMRIQVSSGGQIRMCDPSFPSTDPQGCPP